MAIKNKIQLFLLLFIDYFISLISAYLTTFFFEGKFQDYINLLFIYSSIFFLIFINFNFLFNNYLYLNRYFNIYSIGRLFLASLLTFFVMLIIKVYVENFYNKLFFYDTYIFSFSFLINQVILFIFFLILYRLIIFKISNKFVNLNTSDKWVQDNESFVIYGIGSYGLSYIENAIKRNLKKPIYIIDDDLTKISKYVYNIKIISYSEFEKKINLNNINVSKVIFCIPSLNSFKKKLIKNKFDKLNIKFVEAVSENEIKEQILNIINKNSSKIQRSVTQEIKKYFLNKSVLITGAAGSIGREICYKLCETGIKKIITIDFDECRSANLINDIKILEKNNIEHINYVININNIDDLKEIFEINKPEIIYHAAASKHVDLVENNWFSASMNNLISTKNIIDCSVKYNSQKVVFISTDKAVEPENFLGLSKAVGEHFIKIYSKEYPNLNFSTVRFGNVIGSSGSFLDVIKKQIETTNHVNITDKNMTRFFMTISDAVSLVIVSTVISKNGDCHILKMGKPIKIIDIANEIIKQNNLQNNSSDHIKINFIGRRPGEKLSEKLYYEDYVEYTENEYILNEKKSTIKNSSEIENFFNDIEIFKKDKSKFKNIIVNFLKH